MNKIIYFSKIKLMIQILVITLFVSFCGLAQDPVKSHYSGKNVKLFDGNTYNLTSFNQKNKMNIGLDVLKLIDEKYLEHPDLGYSTHPNYKGAIELVDKRDFYHSTYELGDGKTVFRSSSTPINYLDEEGWFREIKNTLSTTPISNKVYRAGNQPIPKTIDAASGKTSFETPIGNFYLNQKTKIRFFSGSDEIGTVHELNTEKTEIGENGMFVSNAFPNIDMQIILMKNGHLKTNYIIKDKSVVNSQSEFMVFEDFLTVPKGVTFEFETEKGINNGNEQDWDGSLVFRDENQKEAFTYLPPFIYDDVYTTDLMNLPTPSYNAESQEWQQTSVDNEAYTYSSYRVEKINETTYKISVVVKTSWLLASERVYPIVVDPVTFDGNDLTWIVGVNCSRKISGTVPSDNPGTYVSPGNYSGVGCYTTTSVLPAGYMLITNQPAVVSAGYRTRNCAANNTFMKFYGPCGVYPNQAGFFYFCNTNLQNVDCNGAGIAMDGILSRCNVTAGETCLAPIPPSCSNQTLTFTVCYQTRSCAGGTTGGCYKTSNVDGAQYVDPAFPNFFEVDLIGERILASITGGGNICPNTAATITFSNIRNGVPNAFSTSNCTDQMGGTYTMSYTATGGTLSAGPTQSGTTGSGTLTWTSPATTGTYTVTAKVCGACPALGDALNCVTQNITFNVGEAIAPIVANATVCSPTAAVMSISNIQTTPSQYTYTWYSDATGTTSVGTTTTGTRSYSEPPGATYPKVVTYSVRATSPCNSSLTTFTITWLQALTPPTTTGAAACPGQLANLFASCTTCNWYTASSGGTSFNTTNAYVVNPVPAGGITYYVSATGTGCTETTRTAVTVSPNGLIVTTNPSTVNVCSPNTSQFTTSITGNNDIKPVVVCSGAGTEVVNQLAASTDPCTGADCTTANSGELAVTAPAGLPNPMTSTSIQQVCFTITGSDWCGRDSRFYLTSPAGTTFTLYAGRNKNSTNNQPGGTICFNDIAPAPITIVGNNPQDIVMGSTYDPDGGSLSNTFVGENGTGSWQLNVVDINNGGGSCGNGSDNISNLCITYGVPTPPTYVWSGSPGSLSSSTISNPVYTPPAINYSGTYTVSVTDANGCVGTGTVGVSCVLLPIELISFTGEMGDKENYLYWNTATELNSDYFEIERSKDGIEFFMIGTVKAAGNSVSLKEYSLVDKTRHENLNYYRLKTVDLNGSYTYSNIVLLNKLDKDISLEIIPNPANAYVDLSFSISYSSVTSISIYDVKGQLVEKIVLEANKGLNSHKVNLENYAKGLYNVVLNINGDILTKRFIKQ